MSAAQDLGEFLDEIWGEQDGYAYMPVKETATRRVRKFFIHWPEKRDAAIRHILKWAATDGVEVYFSPALYSRMNPGNDSVLGSRCAWVDFDGNFPEKWPTKIAPKPHLEVQSSGTANRHAYWILDEFVGRKDIERINRSLAYALNADTSGWDANQFLRPPMSVNRKYKSPIVAKVVTNRSEISDYPLDAFNDLPTPAEAIRQEIELEEIPDIDKVRALANWDEELLTLFQTPEKEAKAQGFDRSGALAKISYKGAELGWTDEQIYAALLDADERWGKYSHRATRSKILIELINRARAKIGYDVGSESALLKSLLGSKSTKEENEEDESDFFTIGQLNEIPGISDWHVEGLLTPGGIGLFTGHAGTGKTQLAFQLAADLACGRGEFIETFALAGKPCKVLFLSLEMGKYQLGHFTAPLSERYTEAELETNLTVYAKGEPIAMNQEAGQNLFVQMLDDYKPDVVIVDSLSHMSSADLKSDEDMKRLFEFLNIARQRFGFGMVIVHHHRKKANDAASRKQANSQNDIYGSFYITAAIDFALDLEDRGGTDGLLDLQLLKARYRPKGEPMKLARDDQLHFTLAELDMDFDEPGKGLNF